ncbi:MAG: hypothetical protein PVF45_02845 [Anaerolineae bacterium]|jgi:hypothetical protein
MSTYGLDEVIKMWGVGKLTPEQAIGQILLLIQERDERLQELEDRVSALRQALNGDSGRRFNSERRSNKT